MIERVKAANAACSDGTRLGAHFWMQLRSQYTINDSGMGALQVKCLDELVPPTLRKALEAAGTANVGARSPREAHHIFPDPTCL